MKAVLPILCLLLLTGCAVQPWVQPYERARLADPIMSRDRSPAASAYLKHVHESRERARGAEDGAGGGCGCS